MVVYLGMLLWVFLIGLMQPNQHNPLTSNKATEYRAKWGLAIALMLPVTFFAMVRFAPIDTQTYIWMYRAIPTNMGIFEEWLAEAYTDSQLFYGVEMVFKCLIKQDYMYWLGFVALVHGALLTKTLQKYSPNIAMSVYIFMASTMFTWMYNGVRQFTAVCILFALSECFIKNRWYIYIPVVLLVGGVQPICEVFGWADPPWFLCGIHQSALLMIPIFFFVQGKAWNWKMLLFVAGFMALLLSGGLDSALESATETTAYAVDMQYVQEDNGAHPLRAVVPLVPVAMALLKYKEIRQRDDIPKMITVCINMSIITVAVYVASVLTSGIFVGRLPIYTEVYNLILIPWLIHNLYKKDQQLFAFGVYGAYFLWFVYQMYIAWGGLSYASEVLGIYFYGGTW